MADPNLTPEKYKQLVDDLEQETVQLNTVITTPNGTKIIYKIAKPVITMARIDVELKRNVVYLRNVRPTRLRRIINWVCRRSNKDTTILIGCSSPQDWTQPIGVALEDGKILFRPAYSALDDLGYEE